MTHLKRNAAPKSWPIPRKGTKFIVRAGIKELPLLVALRDILKLAKNRKEVKKAVHERTIAISGKLITNDKAIMNLFDVLTIIPSKENYALDLSDKGKYTLKKISEKEAKQKIIKIINKKVLKGKKTQLNLFDGRNILESKACGINDSLILDLETKKVAEILPMKEKSSVLVIEGKHIGEKGTILKIIPELKMARLNSEGKEFNVLIKQLMVIK